MGIDLALKPNLDAVGMAMQPAAAVRRRHDAHVAAILLQHGVRTLYTSDRDFRKFGSIEVRDPFA